ncbi:MAG: hypothetical protein C5B49_02640, partial [Bdellovibrio sp.]
MRHDSGKPILVIQTAFLGDVLLSGALLKEIRRQRPESPIHLVTRQGFALLMKALGYADEVWEVRKGDSKSYEELTARLRDSSYEWIFCPHPSLRSKLLVNSLKAEAKIGYSEDWFSWLFFSHRVGKALVPEALKQWSLITAVVPQLARSWNDLQRVNWNARGEAGLLPPIRKEISIDCRSILLAHPPPTAVTSGTWAIFPGSVWATKQWSTNGFCELAERIDRQGFSVLWMGGVDEAELCHNLATKCPATRSLAGQCTLLETLAILARCEGAVANDSGGQHLAAVAGIPILSIFGPTTLAAGFRPWGRWTAVAERPGLFCRPCGPHGDR